MVVRSAFSVRLSLRTEWLDLVFEDVEVEEWRESAGPDVDLEMVRNVAG